MAIHGDYGKAAYIFPTWKERLEEAVKMIKWQISPSLSLTHFLSSSISSWVLPLLEPLLLTNVRIYLANNILGVCFNGSLLVK